MDRPLFLTGFMGSGKSTIGKALARHMERPFIDTDECIEKELKMKIGDIFASRGEAWFRRYEEKLVAKIIFEKQNVVISLGGGTLISQKTTQLILAQGILIYIKSKPEKIWERIGHSTRRPLLLREGEAWKKEEYLERMAVLMTERQRGYEAAHFSIDRDGKKPAEITKEIFAKLRSIGDSLAE